MRGDSTAAGVACVITIASFFGANSCHEMDRRQDLEVRLDSIYNEIDRVKDNIKYYRGDLEDEDYEFWCDIEDAFESIDSSLSDIQDIAIYPYYED